MGRYVFGTKNFTYKYVFAGQPTNLHQLAAWSGIEQAEQNYSLFTQFYAPHAESMEDAWQFVTGVSWSMSCYQGAAPPYDLIDDIEGAIASVCDRWANVIRDLDVVLPGIAIGPDIGGGQSFGFWRKDWPAIASKIGHGADPSDAASLRSAQEAVAASGEHDYLPLLAVRALRHAVKHDIGHFEMVDTEQRQTNLWEVASEYEFDATSWEDRYVFARLQSFRHQRKEASALFETLLAERPTAISAARGLFADRIWDEDWAGIHATANMLLEHAQYDAVKGELLMWRGDALCCLDRRGEARGDAEAAAELGFGALLSALDKE